MFSELKVGKKYDRHYLADLWGYKGFHAIAKGVVTPSGSNVIILFVTKEKESGHPQYQDYIDGNLLHWEGQEKHFSDNRIINAKSARDEIHLFYREVHRDSFVYYGEIFLKEHNLRSDAPSQFLFHLSQEMKYSDLLDEIETHESEYKELSQTEKESIIKSRIGQGIFRERVVELWGSCAVTGLSNLSLLRASHIKPWRDSTNQERLDSMNGLLLQPTLDHLFDTGLITFDKSGSVIFSSKLSQDDIQKLALPGHLRLKKLPVKLMEYMEYHRDVVFKTA